MNEISVEEFNKLRQQGADFLLLDVREPMEYDICNLGGKLMPVAQVPERLAELDKEQHIIVHCKSGGRSQRIAQYLSAAGFKKVSNLTGGIIEWIEKIDPSLQKY